MINRSLGVGVQAWSGAFLVGYLILCPMRSAETAPSSRQVSRAQVFEEPLLPISEPAPAENQALTAALEAFGQRTVRDDFSSLTGFLEGNQNSPWSLAVENQLGHECYRVGRYSKAIEAWKHAWESGKTQKSDAAGIVANRAVSELALMYARLGRMTELRAVLAEIEGRPSRGLIPRNIAGASDGLWSMEQKPEVAFRCGPLALDRICAATDRAKAGSELIRDSKSTTNGISARDVARLSQQLGLDYQVAFRTRGAEVILPAVVHWKVGHYAALIARDGSLIRAEDPTFGNKTWLSDDALDDEASGYFLVRSGQLPTGWRTVDDTEAGRVWGKGSTDKSDPDSTTPYDEKAKEECGSGGMATWNVHLLLASQIIEDTPVGYAPPVGPPVYFTLTYNSKNAGANPAGLTYGSVGPDWRCNWIAYVTDDPMNPAGDIKFAVDGGGTLTFTDYNSTNKEFRNLIRNRANLVRTSTNSYEIRYPDGSKKEFAMPTAAAGTARKIFMTAVVDPAGNAVTLQYDSGFRLTNITDAIGQKTTLHYELPWASVPPLYQYIPQNTITRVVDPFGRSALLQYDTPAWPSITNITDSIGLSSSFRETSVPNVGQWISSMTTPYGTTRFVAGTHKGVNRSNWLEITNPDGTKERVEYSEESGETPASDPLSIVPKGIPVRNHILWARNTFYWDRKAYAEAFGTNGFGVVGYAKAKLYHFTHGADYTTASPIVESFKEALENRVWFNYDGQVNPTFQGTSDQPTKIARVLDDGSTQLYQFEYNPLNKLTRAIDPVGRTTSLIYETNQIDLKEVRQLRAGQSERLFAATYNTQHLPLTVTDAAGQTTTFTYNSRGQVLTMTNPLNERTAYSYDANGYLKAVDGPLTGTNDHHLFAYDAVGRLESVTDSDGYILKFEHDAMDRLTRITYPDNTFEAFTYNRLDVGVLRDRGGKETQLTFDSLRQLTSVQDAAGRLTRYEWCGCGDLDTVIDPMGHATSWIRDVQGRAVAKIYPGGLQVSYDYEPGSGNLRSIRDEKNQITYFRYNIDGTLREKSYLNAAVSTPAVAFTYDPDYPRIRTMTDGTGLTTYDYHPVSGVSTLGAGQIAGIDGPLANDTVSYQYDELGRTSSRAINGVAMHGTWDEAGRLTKLTNALGAFTYDWDGLTQRLLSRGYPNGQKTEYAYHPNNRDHLLQRVTHRRPDGGILSEFTYNYNAEGQITNWTKLQEGSLKTVVPAYDAINRLVGVTESTSGGPVRSFAFGYDAADNRTLELADNVQHEFFYNPLNQLINITTNVPPVTYAWDVENRLVAINRGTHRTEFSYDGLNRRTQIVEKEGGLVVSDQRFLWCGTEICEERNGAGVVQKRLFSQGEQILVQNIGLSPGDYFYSRDHLASVRGMTFQTGASAGGTEYDPYGSAHQLSGTMGQSFGFAGFLAHAPSGLSLAPFRAYDSGVGRWLNRDPIGELGGLNLYAYVGGNPINRTDPLGLLDDVSRPDLLEFRTGNETVDKALSKAKWAWDKASPFSKYTKPAEDVYKKVETVIETANDAEKVSKLVGKDCDIGKLNDPHQNSWKDLANKGKEGQGLFSIGAKYIKKLTGKIPGLNAVTAPATDLGPQVLDRGVQNMESSFQRQQSLLNQPKD